MEKIKFSDLNGWLKTAVVLAWINGILMVLSFTIGFIQGSMAA